MGKNDYRRALIMLRGLEKGYTGHARLEKRVMSGTLDFTVSTPTAGEALSAALIGPRGARLAIKPLGDFRDDDRGQKGLLASFDPRNIEGLELSDVTAAVVLREEDGGAVPVMYGWINGSKHVDWTETVAEMRAFYARPVSGDGLPLKTGESNNVPGGGRETAGIAASVGMPRTDSSGAKASAYSEAGIPNVGAAASVGAVQTGSSGAKASASSEAGTPGVGAATAPDGAANAASNDFASDSRKLENTAASDEYASDLRQCDNTPANAEINEYASDSQKSGNTSAYAAFNDYSSDSQESEDSAPNAEADTSAAVSDAGKAEPAGRALELDMSRKWPEDVEELRALFLTLPRYEPFELDGFVFVRAGMAAETGIDHCAVGIRAEDGRVTGVSYAIPMAYSADPPAGLEDAVWIGDGNRGWWVTVRNLPEEAV